MSARVRLATPADAPQILEIYAPLVLASTVTFELEPPSLEGMAERVARVAASLPWLVLEGARRRGVAAALGSVLSRYRGDPR